MDKISTLLFRRWCNGKSVETEDHNEVKESQYIVEDITIILIDIISLLLFPLL